MLGLWFRSPSEQKNFKDANLREVARQKVTARKVEEQPKYRDRASERRVLFNQPDVPLPEKDPINTKQKKSEGPPSPPSPPPIDPGKDTNNVGNKLLKMMGWTEGSGLGTSGEGRVEPMFVALPMAMFGAHQCHPLVKPPSMHKELAWEPAKAKKLENTPRDTPVTFIWLKTR